MASDNTTPAATDAADESFDVDAALEKLLAPPEPTTRVVLFVHNGLVIDGKAQFVPTTYEVTATTLMEVQNLLSRGSMLNVPDAVTRATAAVSAVIDDEALASEVAAHLVQTGLVR